MLGSGHKSDVEAREDDVLGCRGKATKAKAFSIPCTTKFSTYVKKQNFVSYVLRDYEII